MEKKLKLKVYSSSTFDLKDNYLWRENILTIKLTKSNGFDKKGTNLIE